MFHKQSQAYELYITILKKHRHENKASLASSKPLNLAICDVFASDKDFHVRETR